MYVPREREQIHPIGSAYMTQEQMSSKYIHNLKKSRFYFCLGNFGPFRGPFYGSDEEGFVTDTQELSLHTHLTNALHPQEF